MTDYKLPDWALDDILVRADALLTTPDVQIVKRDMHRLVKLVREQRKRASRRRIGRERVHKLKAQGLTGEQIAQKMGISQRSVWYALKDPT